MTVVWSCSNDFTGSNGLDKCCYANQTCAEYVCGHFNATITTAHFGNEPFMYNCFVDSKLAAQLELDAPNSSCRSVSGGAGCLVNNVKTGDNATTGSDSAAMRGHDCLHESWILGFLLLCIFMRRAL